MSSNTSGGVGHGGLPTDALSGPEATPPGREAVAAKRPLASTGSGSESEAVRGEPESTASAKRPLLAVTLMGIPAATYFPKRDQARASGHEVNPRGGETAFLTTAVSGAVPVNRASTGTVRARNMGGRLKPKLGDRGATAEGAKRSVAQVSVRRVPADSDPDEADDNDEGDVVVAGSSVLGRCLVGAAVGVTLALLMIGAVRMGGPGDGAHDADQGFHKSVTPLAPRWKPATPFSPPPPATTTTPAIEDQAVPDDSIPSPTKGGSRKTAASEGPSVTGPGPAASPEEGGTLDEQPLDGSGTPTVVGAPAADPLRSPSRSKRSPPRPSTASQPAQGAAIVPPPAVNLELPSARSQQPGPSSEKLKSKSGPGSDPDSTMAPSLD